MSYRHSSYRKLKRAAKAAEGRGQGFLSLERHYENRWRHWLEQRPCHKPAGWGVPRKQRRAG